MKTLKFKHEFINDILEGRKTTTWRLFDDKDLKAGDEINVVDAESGEACGTAAITDVQVKMVKDLTDEELKNHGYENLEAMLESHRRYYGDKVGSASEVKMLAFNFKK